MAARTRPRGFTLVELVATLAIVGALATAALARYVDLRDEARRAAVEEQAANLIARDTFNVAACQAGSPECIAFSTTGFDNPGVCQDAIAQFLPEAGDRFEATTHASSTPREQWSDLPDADEALFWATRTVDVPFPRTVPCTLAHRD